MAKRLCISCRQEFDALCNAKTCSIECRKIARREYSRRPEVKEKTREYNGRSEVAERRRKWRRQPKVREAERTYAQEYHQRPEVKDADHKRDRKRRERPERKEYERERKRRSEHKVYMREYQHRPKRKQYMRIYIRDYGRRPEAKEASRKRRERPEVKEQRRAYAQRPEARASKIARAQTPEYKAKAAERYQRVEVKTKQRDHLRKTRALDKLKALEFARELLAGKYPDLIPANHKPCLLYTAACRETGRILYIGITKNWEARQTQHAATHKGAAWLPAAEVTIDVYPSRTLARAAEMVAIMEHRPVFNVVHNPDSRRAVAA
jgi:hypothetical protein